MASNKPWDRHLVTNEGLVMTDSHSTRLAKGQIGIFDMSQENQTRLGNPAVSTFAGAPANRKFEIKLGIHDISPSRSQSNKSMATIPFTLGGVKRVAVSAPTQMTNITDEWLVGFDGRAGTELVFNAGETTELSVLLKGEAMGILGYTNAEALFHLQFTAPQAIADVNNEKIVTEAVKAFKREEFIGQYPVTELLDITTINSENVALVGTNHDLQELSIQDEGGSSDLALVQAQYPAYDVKKTNREGNISTYTALAKSGLVGVVGGSFVIGQEYEIVTIGTTDFTAIGASENTIGVKFVATGIGAGTGTADEVELGDFSQDVNGTIILTDWTVIATGKASTEAYTIRLADDAGNTSRLAELQAAYPDLTIAEVADTWSPALCQRDYSTTVVTNVVFEECSPEFNDLFESEAPAPYDFIEWETAEPVYSATAKMGIRFKVKETVLAANSEALRHQFPFYNTSARLEVSGGYPIDVNESFARYTGGIFNIKLISRAQERSNLGGNLQDWETRGDYYFTRENAHKDNLYARHIYGRESDLDELVQYVDYIIEVSRTKFAQGFNDTQSETIIYHILAPVGKNDAVESIVNVLAVAAGLDAVEAYPA
jgi:hypothetical protein